jgi:hypothetical protein
MKRGVAAASLVLLLLGLAFFHECVTLLARRDYVAAILVMFIGFAVMRGGAELARLVLGARRP